ncbi:MAG: N-acetylglucosaminyldiphosphoundecaprenol N-acetyl-beta-D-mannosaminyltransferase [Bacteroidia bacterium]|jgi:N-acetylglucosaminyldiphosphoundecaprenol N-acetyl-beta-D-mannosaminyltransferase
MATVTQKVTVNQGAAHTYFGTTLTPISFEKWLGNISLRLEQQQRGWLTGHHNLHSLYLRQTNPDVAAFYEQCDECYLDGIPLRFILAGMGISTSAQQRFSLMDRFEDLLSHAQSQQWSIYYLGSHATVVTRARVLLQKNYPNLRIELHAGYDLDSDSVCSAINDFAPDLLLVGLGMPGQEQWLSAHRASLDAGVAMQAGATLDYFAGAQARPPKWLSQLGLAWLYRLVHDPSRLWQRYLVEPWSLLLPTLQLWRNYRRGPRP